MTTSYPSMSPGAPDSFDAGPLSWVIGEVREALNRSKAAVRDAIAQDAEAQSTSLRHAKSYLHQAHGALQIVDVDGVALITETAEDLLDRVAANQLALDEGLADAIDNGYQALVEYLDELLSGMPHQPVRLFPYYRALLQARGAERIHPADLFFPNLSIRPSLPPLPQARTDRPVRPARYTQMRQHFEKALLPFLRSSSQSIEQTHAAAMRDIIGEVECAQSNPQARAFWWVMHGLAEGVAGGQIPNEIYVKQLFARINLQIRRLSQGSSSIAERLLRDALFFIARAIDPTPHVRQIRDAYRLDGMVPQDYDARRYGQIDVDALAAARERLAQAKIVWNRISGGDTVNADTFEHEMHLLAEAGVRLHEPALLKLLRELKGIARHAAHARPGDMLGLEMATGLLFVENALNRIGHLPANFAERADAMTARLLSVVSGDTPAEAAPWLDDMSREAQQRQTMAALAGEMQSSLRQVEKMLDEYFRDPAQRSALGQLDTMLHQIEGALAVLDQDDAMRTVQHTRAAVRRFIEADAEEQPERTEFQQVAQNVGALSFFIETLQRPSESATKRFSFDEASGTFHAHLIATTDGCSETADIACPAVPPEEDCPQAGSLAPPALPTVEDELALRQQQSADLAMSLTVAPDNQALQEQLKESLEQIRRDAVLVDNPEANDRAQAGIDILARGDLAGSQAALADIITATVPVIAAPAPLPAVVAPDTDEAIGTELLGIFLSEAEEVLAAVRQTLPESQGQPHNQEHLTTLRRCFHTLKGSSRMVGLTAFGEVAWGIEQVLNLRLSASRSGDAELYALLDNATETLSDWVQDLRLTGHSAHAPDTLVSAAERVKAGGRFCDDEVPQQAPVTAAAEEVPEASAADEIPPPEQAGENDGILPEVEEDRAGAMDEAGFAVPDELMSGDPGPEAATGPEAAPLIEIAEVIDFPSLRAEEARRDDNVRRIGDLEISVPLHNIYLAETDELVRLLANDFAEWRHEPEREVNIHAVHAAHSLAGSSATVGFMALQEVAHALEQVLQALARSPVPLEAHDLDTLEQSVERMKLMLQKFALGEMPPYRPEYARLLASLAQAFEQRAGMQPPPAEDLAGRPVYEASDADGAVGDNEHDVSAESPRQEHVPDAAEAHDASHPASAGEGDASTEPALAIRDELDADLLPVFLEEGRDILPQLGAALRAWQEQPSDPAAPQSMLRALHTLKGSARMAGAMGLGQHLHDMETRIENMMRLGASAPLTVEDLMIRFDQALQMFEQLQKPETAASQDDAPQASADGPVAVAPPPAQPSQPAFPVAAPQAPSSSPLVRVRADILDRLVNQAGEVSISRSRLETDVGTLKQSLGELTENVARLRDQLREIEMQAETQIASRMAQSGEREFDPLEFDRFTRLQELTRMMAESVNDVGSVHQNLSRTLDTAVDDLSMQARLTRELQQDLMRARMVQFGSISERLFRVTRQASKEVDKRVNLDIRGGAVEIDRGVLERMTGPFEHLLRNAIVHGIEARDERLADGKSETGELLVEVRQEGNEVVMQFSDDGRGLHVARIRDKARRIGLLTDGSDMSDEEVTDLIFHPGFSTAEEITELAGRGVGMDVVRSEAAALGGRVATWSEPGKGTRFTIHLPLTLAVTQVVLLSAGGRTYAVPSVLVEQVQQLKTNALAAAYNDAMVMWQGQRVPMLYLPALLGDPSASPVTRHYSPLLVLKSGNERIAIHVDEVIGNREVVVKNIGPQLARLSGIAGATVLGSGEIVLILNPVPLAQRAAQQQMRAPRLTPSDAPASMGAVAEMTSCAAVPGSVPVQGLRARDIIMVVDDSLTVRRVTQRLLLREGYQVVLAKDGVDALEQLQSVTPAAMLVDIEMPRMDGFDLTRNVRGDERTRHIPIIMITSRTAAKHRNYAMELGVNAYLGKPYREDELLELIAGLAGREAPVA